MRVVGDRFEFTDGTPVKFWGVNLGNTHCPPKPEDGAAWAAFHAKYGVNCVRLHKFVGPGWAGIGDPNDSTRFTAEGLDRLDRFCAELKKRGIYYGWSWIFEHSVRPDDKQRLVAYDELVAAGGSTTRVPVFIAEDIQDLRIAMLTALLRAPEPLHRPDLRRRPRAGLRGVAQRGLHLLLHLRGLQQARFDADLQEALSPAILGMAANEVRLARRPREGLG